MSDNIKIRTAILSDLSKISRFMDEHFCTTEPSLVSYQFQDEKPFSSPNDDDDQWIKECINNETTFVAHDSNNQLVGIAIAGKIGPNEHEETLKLVSAVDDRKFADIMKLIAFIEQKADVCNRLHVPESLHLHIISVHKNCFKNGIAGKLFNILYDTAVDKGYFALSVDCTNYYTAKIAERFNMQLISTVDYDEYNEYCGEKMFIPNEPHIVIRSYALKLSGASKSSV